MPLSVTTYDEKESNALLDLSNDHIRAFSPVTFIQLGFPIRIEHESQIIRYIDTMQELNNPRGHYHDMPFTVDEARLITDICDVVSDVSHASLGKRIRPWMGPLATMKIFRAIESVSAVIGRKLRVLEIGPGSGYLGAMLIKQGHHYTSMDITQGFYLWQSRLMEALAPDEFLEGVEETAWPYSRTARVSHIPWWDYVRMARFQAPQYDVIVCDHALGEMHVYALRYVTQLSRLMLEESPNGIFMYSSIGAPNVSSEEAVRLNFERVGLTRLMNGEISAFAISGSELPAGILRLSDEIPLFGSTYERVRGCDFMTPSWDEAPPSYEMYKFMGFETPMDMVGPGATPSGTPVTHKGTPPASSQHWLTAIVRKWRNRR